MSFMSQAFLAAMVVVGVPALLHLLHRKRFRTVEWAAMAFLLDAVQRKRRWLEFRDLLLMALRTLVVFLFILAMARPFWVSGPGSPEPDGPVHVVLAIDNSMSMAYRPFSATLLEEAKDKARDLIHRLPHGSAVSIVPGSAVDDFHLREVYFSKEDALEALDDVMLVDRSTWSGWTAERVRRALQTAQAIPTKRVIFLGDQQRSNWSGGGLGPYFEGIEEVQVALVGEPSEGNSWIESFRLRDGFAGRDAPAVILAQLRHEGAEPRNGVRVTLEVDGVVAEERYIDLLPGQNAELVFKHTFEAIGTPDQPVFVPVSLSLSEDRLPEDDHRWMVVPVVAEAPVVCIDTLGGAEDPALNQYGETYPVRRLLGSTDRGDADASGHAIQVRHLTPSEVTAERIDDARLVLVAGTTSPSEDLVRLLRSYVEQGGIVVVTAGGWFDPERWSRAAWQEGEGILPLPLKPDAIGRVPSAEDEQVESFRLDPGSFADELLNLGLPVPTMRRLVQGPFFFRAVAADESVVPGLIQSTCERIDHRRRWIEQNNKDEARWADQERAGSLTAEDIAARDAGRAHRREMAGRWLRWVNPLAIDPDLIPADELAERYRPQVMARYDNGVPFAVRRGVGQGQLVFVSTGLLPRWNSLATDHAVILIDQMIRGLVTQTIPSRNLGPTNQVIIPLPPAMEGRSFVLESPGDPPPRAVLSEAIGPDRLGLLLRDVHQRGVYRLIESDETDQAPVAAGRPPYLVLAINGPGAEGDLQRAKLEALDMLLGETSVTVTPADRPLSLSGRTYRGRDAWRWLIAATLALLITEMVVLSLPHLRRADAKPRGEVALT